MSSHQVQAAANGVSVGTASTLIIGPNERRVWLSIVNDGGNDAWLALGQAAVLNKGIHIKANGGAVVFDATMPWEGEVRGIASVAVNVCVEEVEVKP